MRLFFFVGEKLDFMLETNQLAGSYYFAIQGLHACRNLIHKATLTYDNTDSSTSEDNNIPYLDATEELQGHDCQSLGENIICSLDLKTKENNNIVHDSPTIYYIPFDVNFYGNFNDDMTDYSFNIYDYSYYPSYLSKFILFIYIFMGWSEKKKL